MSVKIRLKQQGSANRRVFRVVVVDESKKRDGKVIETVGSINTLVKPPKIVLDREKIAAWVAKGAQKTDAVVKLLQP